jgi:Fuc2NAc and GlcNAc transferase
LTTAVLVGAVAIAAIAAFAATFPLRRYAYLLRLLDPPNERSSHRVITPRGGGLAIIVACALTLGILSPIAPMGAGGWLLMAAATVIGIVGGLDDRGGLPPSVRLAIQLGVAACFVWLTGRVDRMPLPPPLDAGMLQVAQWIFPVLWLVTITNFFNFMDGLDGLATGQAVATYLAVVLAAWSVDATVLAAAAGGACIGFLLHNWPPARMFMGDSGSGFLGFSLAGLPLLAAEESRSRAILATAISLSLFLLDPLVTLFRRARAGKNLVQAHREHLYQQLVQPDESPMPVTAAYIAIGLLLALIASVSYHEPRLSWPAVAVGLLAFAGVCRAARRSPTRR